MNMSKLNIQGIFKLEGIEGMTTFINIIDIDTYRTTFGMNINDGILSARAKDAIQKNKALLDETFNPEKMLDTAIQNQYVLNRNNIRQKIIAPTKKEKTIAKKKSRTLSEYIALKLDKKANRSKIINQLNSIFHRNKMNAIAYSWEKTAGPMGNMIIMLK